MSKTIEDYRNAVKLLKLKVIKLKKELETAQSQNPETNSGIDENQDLTTLTNQQVMQVLYKQTKKLGLTPEMLFRSCDEHYQG